MGSDPIESFRPGEGKSFNTAGILTHFVNLMNPKKEGLDPPLQTRLIALGNNLAHIGKELQNPLPNVVEKLRAHLGTPNRASKGMETLLQLNTFENNHLPNLILQQEELKKAREQLVIQYQLLVAKGGDLDRGRLDSLKAEVEKVKEGKLQTFIDQKARATEILTPLKATIEQIVGKGKIQAEQEEPTTTATPPAQPTPVAPETAAPPTPQTPSTPSPE
jgi:hypothetical protein